MKQHLSMRILAAAAILVVAGFSCERPKATPETESADDTAPRIVEAPAVLPPAPKKPTPAPVVPKEEPLVPPMATTDGLPFTYPFKVDGRLEEAEDMAHSTSPYWWVDSGAYMYLLSGIGGTVHGDLPLGSKWQQEYATDDAEDTDGGLHPQNIFRMLLRTEWQDVAQTVSYRIDANRFSASHNRDVSNGLLQLARYQDQYDLYYAGVRVDGNAVIKKKYKGEYHTLDIKQIFPGTYDRAHHPSLLPVGEWIRLKTVTKNLDAHRVSIKLYTDVGATGKWKLAAEAVDDGRSYGGAALTEAGYVGLRTDFMDVSFDDFTLTDAGE